MIDEISVPPDPTRISAEEFHELRKLTLRYGNDAKAIFSTNGDEVWASTRFGRTPSDERKPIENIPYILDQLRRSLIARRIEGGRLFVDYEGAYWKGGSVGSIEKVRFVVWLWKGDPPQLKERHEFTSLRELREFTDANRKKQRLDRGKNCK